MDGWVYFIVNDNLPDGRIYKVRTDGTEKQVVVQENSIPEKSMIVVKDTIYYIDQAFGITCVKTDGTQMRTLMEGDFIAMCVADGWIYYITYNPVSSGNTAFTLICWI